MQKLCTNCHFVGTPNDRDIHSNVVTIFSVIVGIGLIILGFWHPLFILGVYLPILIIIAGFSFNVIQCPKCKEDSLLPVKSQEAQNIILVNNLEIEDKPESFWDTINAYDSIKYTKRTICPKCHKAVKQNMEEIAYMYWGSMLLIAGIFTIPLALFHPLYLIINAYLIIGGFTIFTACFMKPIRCMDCGHKPLLSLNSPEARKLIKEHDIKDIGLIMDPVTESKIYSIHENIVFAFMIGMWILIPIIMFFVYLYFRGLQ